MTLGDLAALERAIDGDIVEPDHAEYDSARALWNAMIDKRPGAIVRCLTTADVAAAIAHAGRHGLKVAIRGGGHSAPGHSMCDAGLVVDLSRMRGVRIDAERREGFVQGGCLLGDMDRAARLHGLATPAGAVSHTGVAGLTLGGGIGHIMRRYGLTIDNLLGCEVVTADGRVRWADAESEPELFWGLRGGGGNFGVVTEFKFRMHRVDDPYLAMMIHRPEDFARVMARKRAVMADDPPDELQWATFFRRLDLLPGIPAELHDQPMVLSVIEWHGDNADGARALDPLVAALDPLIRIVGPVSYLDMQSMIDDVTRAGNMAYSKAGFFAELTDGLIAELIRQGDMIPSRRSFIEVITMGGAVARVAADATAFPHRDAAFVFNVVGLWEPEEDNDRNIGWVRRAYAALEPHSTGGAYVNYMGGEETGGVNAAYGSGPTFDRLRAVKARYDPANMFCFGYSLAS